MTMGWKDNRHLVAPVFVEFVGFTALDRFVDGVLVALGAYIVLFDAGQPGPRRPLRFIGQSRRFYRLVRGSILASISPRSFQDRRV
jgi:hypothetical protein